MFLTFRSGAQQPTRPTTNTCHCPPACSPKGLPAWRDAFAALGQDPFDAEAARKRLADARSLEVQARELAAAAVVEHVLAGPLHGALGIVRAAGFADAEHLQLSGGLTQLMVGTRD
mgnify:CR=1 FL=1